MNVTDGQIYEQFTTVIRSLIKRTPQPEPEHLITVRTNGFPSVGMGGYVGQNTRSVGGALRTDELHGRRLQGLLIVGARDQTETGIETEVGRILQVLSSAERSALLVHGIQRMTLREIGPLQGSGSDVRQRDITFDVLFEFVTVPDSIPDTINEVDVRLQTDGMAEHFSVT